MLNALGLVGTGVEVGVKLGEYSEELLAGWRGRRLLSVDAWSAAFEPNPARPHIDEAGYDLLYDETCRRLARFGDRSEVWRLPSAEAAKRIPPGSLDFVYIDANHDFESVASDLDAWFDRVRAGGLLAGHDYYDGLRDGHPYGVKSAVDAMCARRGLRVECTLFDAPETT